MRQRGDGTRGDPGQSDNHTRKRVGHEAGGIECTLQPFGSQQLTANS